MKPPWISFFQDRILFSKSASSFYLSNISCSASLINIENTKTANVKFSGINSNFKVTENVFSHIVRTAEVCLCVHVVVFYSKAEVSNMHEVCLHI